jgi:hypothetical protein
LKEVWNIQKNIKYIDKIIVDVFIVIHTQRNIKLILNYINMTLDIKGIDYEENIRKEKDILGNILEYSDDFD